MVVTTKSAPGRSSVRSVEALTVIRSWAPRTSTIFLASLATGSRMAGLMSHRAISHVPKSDWMKSAMRPLVNTALPAPMSTIFLRSMTNLLLIDRPPPPV